MTIAVLYHSAAERPEPPQQSHGEQEQQDEQHNSHWGPIRLQQKHENTGWSWQTDLSVQKTRNKIKISQLSYKIGNTHNIALVFVFIHQMISFCLLYTHTSNGSNSDRAWYEAEAVIQADKKSGWPAEMIRWLKKSNNVLPITNGQWRMGNRWR